MTSIAAGVSTPSSSSTSSSSSSTTSSSSPSPSPSSSSSSSKNTSLLTATVLSAYDLPATTTASASTTAPAPSYVSVSIVRYDVDNNDGTTSATPIMMGKTGPPLAKHRDGNSFRFQGSNTKNESDPNSANANATNSKSNEVVFHAPLSTFYPSTITFTVSYGDDTKRDLVGHVNVKKELRVNEPKWLVLHLTPTTPTSNTGSASTDSTRSTTAVAVSTNTKKVEDDEDADDTAAAATPPTLRVRLLLTGPYRPEISTFLSVGSSWFRMIDSTQSKLSSKISTLPERNVLYHNLGGKYLVIPAIPIVASAVVLTPILTGVLIVGIPFFLPLLAIMTTLASITSAIVAILYFSTKEQRDKWGASIITPLMNTILHTPAGQRLIYDVGPRPTPKSIVQTFTPTDIWSKLIVSLVIDFIGSSSYLIPIVGEVLDMPWAPIQAVLIAAMYDDVSPNLKYVAFVEEILPLTDVIPSAMLGWTREFGPSLWMEGVGKVRDVSMVMQRERDALRSM